MSLLNIPNKNFEEKSYTHLLDSGRNMVGNLVEAIGVSMSGDTAGHLANLHGGLNGKFMLSKVIGVTIFRLITNWTPVPAHAQRTLFLHFEGSLKCKNLVQ